MCIRDSTYRRDPFSVPSVFLSYSAAFMYVYITPQLCCAINGYAIGVSNICLLYTSRLPTPLLLKNLRKPLLPLGGAPGLGGLPVSYTHLDVYKRQSLIYLPAPCIERHFHKSRPAEWTSSVHSSCIPVSYTHLA